jgi:glycerol-3-phosphate acyltransferase PlsX
VTQSIALDAMGGDHAPAETVAGAVQAVHELGLEVALVGPADVLEAEVARHGAQPAGIRIVAAGETIGMDEAPAQAVRQKRDSSINTAMRLVKRGEAAAVVSAGNTGAVMASALFVLGRVGDIERPALGAFFPASGHGVLMLDVGANADCKPSYLAQFAHMGSLFVERVYGVEGPRVGLLNIGEEENKGNELTQEAYRRLQKSALNFVGNVEGKDIAMGQVDVAVMDGFTGNVAIKMSEGVVSLFLSEMRSVLSKRLRYKLAALVLRPAFRAVRKRLDYAEYGGASLLGVNGVVIIAHGRSDATAIKNALRAAGEVAASGVTEAMAAAFKR